MEREALDNKVAEKQQYISFLKAAKPSLLKLLGIADLQVTHAQEVFEKAEALEVTIPLYLDILAGTLGGPEVDNLAAALLPLYQAQQAFDSVVVEQLTLVSNLFADTEIPLVVMKGNALRWIILPYRIGRETADIDVLTPQASLPKASSLLMQLGWQQEQTRTPTEYMLQWGHHLTFEKTVPSARPVSLELHWRIIEDQHLYRLPSEMRNDESAFVPAPDRKMLVPKPEWYLLHAAIHSYSHGYESGVRNAFDTHALLAVVAIDWEDVITQAARLGCQLPLYIILYRASIWFGARVPAKVFTALQPRKFNEVIDHLAERPSIEYGKILRLIGCLNWQGSKKVLWMLAPPASWLSYKYNLRKPAAFGLVHHYKIQILRIFSIISAMTHFIFTPHKS